jgi:hypothetical protein
VELVVLLVEVTHADLTEVTRVAARNQVETETGGGR